MAILTPTIEDPCHYCKGTGKSNPWNNCMWCHGTGVRKIYPNHSHEWDLVKHITPTYHLYRCRLCDMEERVDSSG